MDEKRLHTLEYDRHAETDYSEPEQSHVEAARWSARECMNRNKQREQIKCNTKCRERYRPHHRIRARKYDITTAKKTARQRQCEIMVSGEIRGISEAEKCKNRNRE